MQTMDIKKFIDIVSESSSGGTTAGAVAEVSTPMTFVQKRVEDDKTKSPEVIEYGMWENSALTTSSKLKKSRDKSAKVVKSIYGEEVEEAKNPDQQAAIAIAKKKAVGESKVVNRKTVLEYASTPITNRKDYLVKRKALQDLQISGTSADKKLLMQKRAELERQAKELGFALGEEADADKLPGTPVVSLADFDDGDNTKNKYGQTVPKLLKKDDPRVNFHKDQKQGVAEAAKWRADDKEGKTWRSPDWDDGDLSPSKIKIDRSGKDVDDSGDELTSRPGAWRGKNDMAKRMTKKGVPTKSELAFQNNLKMRMRMKKKEGGLTGPKGVLPEQGVAEGFSTDTTNATTWNGHKIIANRKTPNGSFLILQNKNDGRYEIHKHNPDVGGGLEFKSVHKTPEEMQVAFKKLTGVDEQQGVAEGVGDDIQQAFQSFGVGISDASLAKGIEYILKGRHQEGENWLRSKKIPSEIIDQLKTIKVNPNANLAQYINDKLVPYVKNKMASGSQQPQSAASGYSVGMSDNAAAKKIASKLIGMPVTQKNISSYIKRYLDMVGRTEKDLPQLSALVMAELEKQGVAEGTTQKYEMMLRNGHVKKFVAKDDADAKRIAKGNGAKSVIKLKGNVPGAKILEQDVEEGLLGTALDKVKNVGKKVLDVVAPDDEELLRQLQRSMGIPASSQHGKKSMAEPADDKLDEADLIINPASISRKPIGLIKKVDHTDHEVEMAKSDLYQASKNALAIFQMIKDVPEEVGIEGWVQEKIIKANDYLNTIREYLEGKQLESMDGVAPSTKQVCEDDVEEGKTGPGLWANIHAKRKRIKSGSGERMRKPGSKGAPKASDFRAARSDKK